MRYRGEKSGAITLMLVVMITALTLVTSVTLALINTSSVVSNYHLSEDEQVEAYLDSCIEDALWRLSSTTATLGSFNMDGAAIPCSYEMSIAEAGIKTVTSTASTTSSLGQWEKTVVLTINVSSTPFTVSSYYDASSVDTLTFTAQCGDWSCNGSETCDTCATDCSTCFCGNLTCDSGETCSSCEGDCGACGPVCGNGVVEAGETCDYTGGECGGAGSAHSSPVGCGRSPYCFDDCSTCSSVCL